MNSNDWRERRGFFFKRRNQLLWKSNSNKPRFNSEKAFLCYLQYTIEGILVPGQALVVVSKEKALEILHNIHHSAVRFLDSMVKTSSLHSPSLLAA